MASYFDPHRRIISFWAYIGYLANVYSTIMGWFKGLISMSFNNPINTLTSFAGTHTRGAASPVCPTCLRPLLESYVTQDIHG